MRSPPHPHLNSGNHPFHSSVSLRKLERFNWNKQICSGSERNNGATFSSSRSSTYDSIGHDQVNYSTRRKGQRQRRLSNYESLSYNSSKSEAFLSDNLFVN